jgi:hypothetical protein
MAAKRIGLGVFALAAVLAVAGVAPASAEFFGCKEPHTKVSYSPGYFAPKQSTSRVTHEFAAQRTRHATFSSRPAARGYRSDRWR